jgi:hypothetical protein
MKPLCQISALCVEQLPNYPFPPSYWEERDEELLTKALYQNPRKRKERLVNLKMRCVEELLFDPFLPPKVRKSAASGAAASVAAAAKQCPLSEIVASMGRPTVEAVTFALTCAEAEVPRVRKGAPRAAGAPVSMTKVYCTKARAMNGTGAVLWEQTLTMPKAQIKSKTMACIRAMVAGLGDWLTAERLPDVQARGVKLDVDRALANALRRAVDDRLRERLERTAADADMAALTECCEDLLTFNIWNVLKDIPHAFV